MARSIYNKRYRKTPNGQLHRRLERAAYYGRTDAETAINGKLRWTDEEIALLFDQSLTDMQIALRLGRTLRAVHNKRCLVKHSYAPTGWTTKATPSRTVQGDQPCS